MATRFGKYTLLRKIASGGMAEVFLARAEGDAALPDPLVIKRILPGLAGDPQFVSMFVNEARVVSQLHHPGVVRVFELGEVEGVHYLALEHIDGPNLRSLHRRARDAHLPLTPSAVVKMFSLACEGLHAAHEARGADGQPLNVIHRDISPDNIILSRQGAVKVVDFGVAKAAGQANLTREGVLKGKISYMPPEQIQGATLDRRADVFALGVCLFEVLTGARPFEGASDLAVMKAILHEAPASLRRARADLEADLEPIVARCLEKDREARFPSCQALHAALEQHLARHGASVGSRELARVVDDLLGPGAPVEPSGPLERLPEPPPDAPTITAPEPLRLAPVAGTTSDPVLLSAAPTELSLSQVHAVRRLTPGVGVALTLLAIGGVGLGTYLLGSSVLSPSPVVPERVTAPEAMAPVARSAPASAVAPPSPPPPSRAVAPPTAPPASTPVVAVVPGSEPVASEPEGTHRSAAPHHHAHPGEAPPSPSVAAPAIAAPIAGVAQTGQLEFRVLPWANVEVDRRALGQTPISAVTLDVGSHHVVLTNDALHARQELDVVVSANEVTVVKRRMDQP